MMKRRPFCLADFEKGHHLPEKKIGWWFLGMSLKSNPSRRDGVTGLQRLSFAWSSRHLDIVAIAFWISTSSYVVSSALDFGKYDILIGFAGTASCGFSWLLARALFRSDADRDGWPLLIIAGLILTGVLLDLFVEYRDEEGLIGHSLGAAWSAHSLLSSTVLLLTLIEACLGYRSDYSDPEKRFRIAFIGGYLSLLAITVLWLNGAPEGAWADQHAPQIKIICAGVAISMSLLAWRFRSRHPLPSAKRRQRRKIDASAEDKELADRIIRRLEHESLYLEPELKLADFARQIGERDYRIRSIITGVLGFRNFNALINQYRIRAAKNELTAPDTSEKSVLCIALDVGFASVGPFNRAFKDETGMTPTEFRTLNSQ